MLPEVNVNSNRAKHNLTKPSGHAREILRSQHANRSRLRHTLRKLERECELRRALESRVEVAERRQKEVEALAHIGNWEYDLVTDQIQWSDETFRIFQLDPGATEPNFADVLLSIHPDDRPALDEALQHAIADRQSYRLDLRLLCADGSEKHVHAQGTPICEPGSDQVVRILGTILDITERKRLEEELYRDATYDALTGLMNRRTLFRALDRTIKAARETGAPLSVCVCDVDHFKTVNDTYGHAAGDAALLAFGRQLLYATRDADIAARLGGDEFCLVFPSTEKANAAVCAERIRRGFEGMVFPAVAGGYSVSATFGIAELCDGMTTAELVEAADQALYSAKKAGRNRVGVAVEASVPLLPSVF